MSDTATSHHTALIYVMVVVSAADSDMTDREIEIIGRTVRDLPAFEGFDRALMVPTARSCGDILSEDNGLETVLGLVCELLPDPLKETAYGLACEVALADGNLSQEELRLLDIIRHRLRLDRLVAAGIERGIDALYRRPQYD